LPSQFLDLKITHTLFFRSHSSLTAFCKFLFILTTVFNIFSYIFLTFSAFLYNIFIIHTCACRHAHKYINQYTHIHAYTHIHISFIIFLSSTDILVLILTSATSRLFHSQAPVPVVYPSPFTLLKVPDLSGVSPPYIPHRSNSLCPIHAFHPPGCLGPCDSVLP